MPARATPRDRVRAIARSVVGLTPSDAAYLALVTPRYHPPEQRAELLELGESASALVAGGVLARAGVVADELEAPYVPGSAVTRLRRLGERAGAWAEYGVPEAGDVVLIGAPIAPRKPGESAAVWLDRAQGIWDAWGGDASAFVIVDYWVDGTMSTIEARVSSPWSGVLAADQREMRVSEGRLWLVDALDRWRRMVGYLNVDALPFASDAGDFR